MIVILMGVAGSGKTTVGQALATEMGWPFYDGDDFHPPANIDKMTQGVPLTDADREPWLRALHAHMAGLVQRGQSAVVACSALKRAYRALLMGGLEPVRWVYLQGSPALIGERLQARQAHFMPPGLLASQFVALEEPEGALTVDVTPPPSEMVKTIRDALAL